MHIDKMPTKNILFSLLLFPLANIIVVVFNGDKMVLDFGVPFLAKQLSICLVVAFTEELFFRGLLLRELVFSYKWKPISASLVISVVFGLLHLFNVNSYAMLGYTIIQSVCAFAVSFNLCAIFIKSGRLLWCVVIHALINITSIGLDSGNSEKLILGSVESIVFLMVASLYFFYGIKMLSNKLVEER